MFTRNRLTGPFTGDVSWLPVLGMKTNARQTKASPPLFPGFDAASQPFCAVTTSSLVIDLRTCAPGSLATFCLGVTGIYFACGSHICDFSVSASCHQTQALCAAPRHAGGVSPRGRSCSQTWKCVKHKTPAVNTYFPAVLKSSIYKTPGFK